jgi:undecaprenyl-diphosphatase
MTVIQSILLGALQGLTEFLPVSSSGHLVVAREIMRIEEIPILFDVWLHVATLAVIIAVFRKRIGAILASLARLTVRGGRDGDAVNARLAGVIVLATVCTVVVGLAVDRLSVNEYPKIVSGLFIVTGLILITVRNRRGTKDYSRIGWREGVATGVAQGFGVFPGISRAGITISASLAVGLERERAGEYAFLMSIPAVVGALLFTLKDSGELMQNVGIPALVAGCATSLVVGLASLLLLLRLVKGGKLYVFSFYLIPLGVAGLIWL